VYIWVRRVAISAVDFWMAVFPRPRPQQGELDRLRIVSHRGEHDNRSVPENTMQAFETASVAGAWGIEADIRWTADMVPVIIHDPDTRRVFGKDITVAATTCAELQKAVPQIPTLAQLVDRFGGNTHMMLEIKAEQFPQLERQKEILRELLSELEAGEDYHFLSLDTDLFEVFDIEPRNCCLGVAEENASSLSDKVVAGGYGGLTGHYLLLGEKIRERHDEAGQQIGTGFIRSRNCLYREINRGVAWIFTNDAVELQRILKRSSSSPFEGLTQERNGRPGRSQ
jgi:glycerophosphoryl diester phosphodiesterase